MVPSVPAVATLVLPDVQVPPVGVPPNEVVEPAQTVNVPDMAGALFTETTVDILQPEVMV
jgi:hypothetical protein